MLSILLPEHNYPCSLLVKKLADQCVNLNIDFEVIVMDDASTRYLEENRKISDIPFCRFVESTPNGGIAKTRNKLAKIAKYPWLIMLDCDLEIVDDLFVKRYLDSIDKAQVLIGSIVYQKDKPQKDKLLRWVYGQKRESLSVEQRNSKPWNSITTPNILMHRSVIESVPFDEEITDYGHEDSMWGYSLKQKGISVLFINNPLIHSGLDASEVFLEKSLVATSKYLSPLFLRNEELVNQIRIFRVYRLLQRYKMDKLIGGIQHRFEKILRKNLVGSNPSLFLFDFYRLGYLCRLVRM